MNKIENFKVGYLISHPIQYQVPLYQYINKKSNFDFEVFFLSDFSIKKHLDLEFKQKFKWGINLTKGYNYKVLKSLFFNKINSYSPLKLNFINILKDPNLKFIIIHGWGNFSNIFFIIQAKFFKKKILLRGESSDHFQNSIIFKKIVRELFLRFLFKLIDGFLYIGENNYEFYLKRKVPKNKLFAAPYCVDNNYFNNINKKKIDQKIKILFVGKFIDRKRVMDLLKAINIIYKKETFFSKEVQVDIIGSGKNENNLKNYKIENNLINVNFLGFKNQIQIKEYYIQSDILVITSENEPWGLVVNEAMAASCAIIASDGVGCARDLVKDGINGYVFPTGNITELAHKIIYLTKNKNIIKKYQANSLNLISQYSFQNVLNGINEAIHILND